jgi:hypothetical protein
VKTAQTQHRKADGGIDRQECSGRHDGQHPEGAAQRHHANHDRK